MFTDIGLDISLVYRFLYLVPQKSIFRDTISPGQQCLHIYLNCYILHIPISLKTHRAAYLKAYVEKRALPTSRYAALWMSATYICRQT